MKHIVLPILIALQGLLLLTHGQTRNKFYEISSHFGLIEHQQQQMAQGLVFIFSFLMMLTLFKGIVMKFIGIIAFTTFSCYFYNVVMFQDVKNISMLILNFIVAGMNCDILFDQMIEEDRQERRRKTVERKNSQIKVNNSDKGKEEKAEKKESSKETKKSQAKKGSKK